MKYTKILIVLLLLMISSSVVFAEDTDDNMDEKFSEWVVEFKKTAHEKHGINNKILEEVFRDVKYNHKIIKSDRNQPEFKKDFLAYYNGSVNKRKIEEGKKLLVQHHKTLKNVQKKYGVQPHVIVALWGKETDYGKNMGKSSVVSVLATMSFDHRRSQFFTNELIQALKIVQSGKVDLKDLKGSWAGAFGNFQFMPSTFMAYAVDGDGDGKIDLRNNLIDSFYSAGNYLSKMGWNGEYRWGRPVIFDKKNEKIWKEVNSGEWKRISYFAKLGIKTYDESVVKVPKSDGNARLIAPMGVDGPTFLIYENFKYIMKWNSSTNYALTVGLLSDAIVDKKPFRF